MPSVFEPGPTMDQAATPSCISIDAFHALTRRELPLAELFGLRVERLEPGSVTARLPYDTSHLRPGGTIAGPALMVLADYTMYAVVLSLIGRVELAVTTNLTCNFLRRPPPADIVAEGRILKLGKRLAFGEVSLFADGAADPVAHVTATYSIPPNPG
jgi:uncharacterized protein (TIGR00369 family)